GVAESSEPFLRGIERPLDDFAPFAFLQEQFGFIPNIFHAQSLLPDVLAAEVSAIRTILLAGDVLTKVQKHYILLVISAGRRNTYWVDALCQILEAADLSAEELDRILDDHHQAHLTEADQTLLDFALKLALQPSELCPGDLDPVRND